MTKVCNICKETKDLSLFYRDKYSTDGFKQRCKICSNKSFLNWVNKNKEKDRERKSLWRESNKERIKALNLQYNYGISLEDYNELLIRQNNKCALCPATTKLVVDHCHKTGKIRGLLCGKCNKGLGMLGDTIETITKVLKYLS